MVGRRKLALIQSDSPAQSQYPIHASVAKHPPQNANSTRIQPLMTTSMHYGNATTAAYSVPWDLLRNLSTANSTNTLMSATTLNANNPDVYFPLSVDHLLTLIQYNVYRAILTNISLLNLLSTFGSCEYSVQISIPHYPSTVPPSLHPTLLQRSTPHSTWIDFFPLAAMRDNLIRAEVGNTYDADELCDDMLGGLFGPTDHADFRGLIAWKDPWDVMGWEVSEGFVRKWGWLLKGCKELAESSNRWRQVRLEESLMIEV